MRESISYLKIKKMVGEKVSLISKSLDTVRDYNLALLSASMISNIIKSRKAVKLNKQEFIYYFSPKEIEEKSKAISNLSTIQMNFD